MAVIGLPLMLLEFSAGRTEDGGVVRTFRAINKKTAWFGWIVVLLTLVILGYYFVITGWTLGFAVDSLSGSLRSFDDFTSSGQPILYFFIVTILATAVVFRGAKLIERLSRYLMPVLFLTIVALTIYSLTLDGAGEALSFLFHPDFSAFTSPTLWALAFGQAFYSLAIGQGYLITYGSFLPKKVNLPRATGVIAGVETGVALIAGLMIFPIVFTFGLNPAEGTELAFATLPIAFADIPIGWLLAIIFFWLFFLAAISSCIASMEVIKTAIEEEWRLSRLRATLTTFALVLPLGIVASLSFTPFEFAVFGRSFLEILDVITANQVVILSGLIGGFIISWAIPKQVVTNLFPNKYRAFASHVVIVARYLWVPVLAILVVSMVAQWSL